MTIIGKAILLISLFLVYTLIFGIVRQLTYGVLPVFIMLLLGAWFFIWFTKRLFGRSGKQINFFKVWEADDVNKVIKTDCELQHLLNVMRCLACKYYRCQDEMWCGAPKVPDIDKYYCYTFQSIANNDTPVEEVTFPQD